MIPALDLSDNRSCSLTEGAVSVIFFVKSECFHIKQKWGDYDECVGCGTVYAAFRFLFLEGQAQRREKHPCQNAPTL